MNLVWRLARRVTFIILFLPLSVLWQEAAEAAQLTLAWTDQSSNETGFKLERRTGTSGSFAPIATLAANTTLYTDSSGLAAASTYCYRLYAFNQSEISAYSNELCGNTPAGATSLTVTKGGNGSGTVTSSPAGVSCGSDCSETYPSGASVTLTATPAAGSTFTGWSGACSGTGTCTVTLTGSTSATATFAPQEAAEAAQLTLAWTDQSSNETGFKLERRTGTSGSFAPIATLAANTTLYTDSSGLAAASTYCYRLYAFNQSEISAYSNELCGNTPGGTTTGLVAAYSFEEGSGDTVADVSGNINTGAISGATWTTQGKFGRALSFNGSSSWIRVNDSNSLDLTTGMTLEAWVYPTTTPSGWRTLIVKDYVYTLYAGSYTNKPLAWIGSNTHTSGGATLPANTWTHLATTYDGTMIRLFINGSPVASLATTGQIGASTGPLAIGGNSRYGEYFQGLIDEVRIYNRALSVSQIQADMSMPLGTAMQSSSIQTFTSTETKATDSSGIVTGASAGFICGSDCTAIATFTQQLNLKIGVFRPSTGKWYLDLNGNGVLDDCATDGCLERFGQQGNLPVVGDWTGTGTAQIGIFEPSTRQWKLDRNGNDKWDGCSSDVCLGRFVQSADLPVVGKWKAGTSTDMIGIYRPSERNWIFDLNSNGKFDNCTIDRCSGTFGQVTDLPVVGDWNGAGVTQIGIFEPNTGMWKIDLNNNKRLDSCDEDACLGPFGVAGDRPIAGDWLGDGKARIGVFDPITGMWELDLNSNGVFDDCTVDACLGPFGQQDDLPVVGKW